MANKSQIKVLLTQSELFPLLCLLGGVTLHPESATSKDPIVTMSKKVVKQCLSVSNLRTRKKYQSAMTIAKELNKRNPEANLMVTESLKYSGRKIKELLYDKEHVR